MDESQCAKGDMAANFMVCPKSVIFAPKIETLIVKASTYFHASWRHEMA